MTIHLSMSIRSLLCMFTLFVMTNPSGVIAADEEGCLICHKYPGLARIDQKTGRLRLFYVGNNKYKNSVHGKILCRNCHLNLDKIPHADIAKVNCSTKCHIKEPSTDREFSHGNIYGELNASVHGLGTEDNPKKFEEDMPKCTDCHINTVLQPVTGVLNQEAGVSADALRRCIGCHSEKEWANRFYQHFSHRLHRSKTSLETVKLCLLCHQDEEKMMRHGLVTTDNYKDTFHWKGVLYGDVNAPDCLSCHAPVGYTIHSMATTQASVSPVHPQNLQQTCSNQNGTQICHPNAVASFSSGKIHKKGLGLEETAMALMSGEPPEAGVTVGKTNHSFVKMMSEEEKDLTSLNEQQRNQWKILMLVKYIYTLLITVVIGGMLIHQMMDFYRAVKIRKNNKGAGHDK
ncbi:cytochrome C [Desulforhopalus sp. IMCC35007]|uniref:cytochrome C n=1 Tax=Desulforhopalus sp. IMCC35007 TaxID=2569543 RepID=UPI0010ADB688|nr:cytochrome C [Desulforhopalus sp. IMCC35007]TKB11381.1 cytochrome C [Desulforhopalus sp. IMCC35007]